MTPPTFRYRPTARFAGLFAAAALAGPVGAAPDVSALAVQAAEAYDGGDSERAADLWRRAAEAGDVDAMTSLGSLLEEGDGVRADPFLARQWYARAAAGGEAHAMVLLAIERLDNDPADKRGLALMTQAAWLGHNFAKRRLAALSGETRAHSDDSIGDHK